MSSKFVSSNAIFFPGNVNASFTSRPISLRRGLWTFASIALLLAALLFYSWSRMLVTHMGYVLNNLKVEEAKQKSESQRLLIERLTLTSPERLEHLGLSKFGLNYPESWQIVDLRNSVNANTEGVAHRTGL
jgi:hypothetical protein